MRAQGAAAEPATVRLDVPDCAGVSGEQVRGLVALELAPRLRVSAHDASAEITGSVACGERVQIEIHDPEQPSPLRLELDLAAAPAPARTRLLALSIAELIATGRLERAPVHGRADEEDAEPESEQRAAQVASAWSVWVAPGLSLMGSPGLTLLGLEAGASHALGPVLLLAQVQGRWGATELSVAELAVQAHSASVAVLPRLSLGALELALGPGVRVGYARLAADAAQSGLQGAALSGAWFGPCAAASVQLALAPWAAVRAGFELGYVTQSVRGHDHESRRLLELDGLWTSATVGAALLLR